MVMQIATNNSSLIDAMIFFKCIRLFFFLGETHPEEPHRKKVRPVNKIHLLNIL